LKPVLRLAAVAVCGGVVGLFLLPFLVAGVVAGQLAQTAQLAAQWDIPPEVVPALQDAGQQWALPWFLLAGIGSVATDFARHAPDGQSRGDAPGTAIFPTVTPPIGRPGGGEGMFLARRDTAGSAPADPQDVRAAAAWLAAQLTALAKGSPLAQRPLSDPEASRFWQQVIAAAPLTIASPATGGGDVTPVPPGDNPIRQFASAVLARISAPSSSANLDAFAAWAAGEGSCARFNPLATTQPEPGATPFNNLSGGGHVWHYPSFAIGVQATTTALTNGLYQPVIAAFQASAGVAAVEAAVVRSPWGTRHFGSTSYAGRQCAGGGSAPGPAPGGAPPPTLPTVAGPDAVPATIVARAIQYEAVWSQMIALAPATTTP
jgi:hypothetical protein